jgi:hypothetical protein
MGIMSDVDCFVLLVGHDCISSGIACTLAWHGHDLIKEMTLTFSLWTIRASGCDTDILVPQHFRADINRPQAWPVVAGSVFTRLGFELNRTLTHATSEPLSTDQGKNPNLLHSCRLPLSIQHLAMVDAIPGRVQVRTLSRHGKLPIYALTSLRHRTAG